MIFSFSHLFFQELYLHPKFESHIYGAGTLNGPIIQ